MMIKMKVKKRVRMLLNRWMSPRAKVINPELMMMNTTENLRQMSLRVKAMANPKDKVLADSTIGGNESKKVYVIILI